MTTNNANTNATVNNAIYNAISEIRQTGSVQWNVKSAKGLRDSLAKWHIADFAIADAIITRNKSARGYNAVISGKTLELRKLEKAETPDVAKIKECLSEIANAHVQVEKYNAVITELKKAQEESLKAGTDLVAGLYKVYAEGSKEEYTLALANIFRSAGVEMTLPVVQSLMVSHVAGTSTSKVKTGNHSKAMTKSAFVKAQLSLICDAEGLKGLLPEHKFVNIIVKKAEKKAQKEQEQKEAQKEQ